MAGTKVMALELYSMTIPNGTYMLADQVYTQCGGENVSPDLAWVGVPFEAKSLALVVHDPDAPREHGFYHWIVVDIPTTVTKVAKGGKFAPPAREITTDFGVPGYNGPCPPVGHGVHHYHFTLYALDVANIELDSGMTPHQVAEAIRERAVGQATIIGLYERR